jgi:hypothetical protein
MKLVDQAIPGVEDQKLEPGCGEGPGGAAEAAFRGAHAPGFPEEASLSIQTLHPVVAGVGYEEAAAGRWSEGEWAVELSRTGAAAPEDRIEAKVDSAVCFAAG